MSKLKQCINKYGKAKRQFETLDEAIEIAKIANIQPTRIHKLVAYKCKNCFKYHIGSNGRELKSELQST